MLAAWQEVEHAEDLAKGLEQAGSYQRHEMAHAAIEHAAAGSGRRPGEWPQHREALRQHQDIHAQCHHYLRGAAADGYATLEEEDQG